jgi:predicted SAM-dependent methyltransferase
MVIEARKPMQNIAAPATTPADVKPAHSWTPEERKLAYNRHYFDGGRGKVGGYSREGYRDFPVHWLTFHKIMERKPESVLELGAARGYILKRLEDSGIRVQGIEISRHCILTRVVDPIVEWDMTQVPWPFADKQFDLCFSGAVLEHIPEQHIDAVSAEIRRVSRRGLHGIDFGHHDDGFDKTHCLFRDKAWWSGKLNGAAPGGAGLEQEVVDKEELEKGSIPLPVADGKVKLNLGSYTTMSHHGWINIDQHDLAGWAAGNGFLYHRSDLSAGIPAHSASVDLLYASHFLEHFTYVQGDAFLKECRRVLKPGGLMRLIVPDGRLLTEKYLSGKMGEYDELNDGCAETDSQATKLWALLFSGHLAMYDQEGLRDALLKAGFTDISRVPFRMSQSRQMLRETVDLFPTLSLFVEAVKT